MKILTISDSFKGTLSSNEIGRTISDFYIDKGHHATYLPISDGGEGFLDVIEYITKIEKKTLTVKDAYLNPTSASYIIDEKNHIAYIELAEASGIAKLDKTKLKAPFATTYGLGELLKYVIQNYKLKKVVMGIGGSGTSDVGAGMLEAMGVEFIDDYGFIIKNMCNASLMKVKKVNTRRFNKLIKNIEFVTLTDVENPLLGNKGAIKVFSPQKGASEEDLFVMEKNVLHFYNMLMVTNKKTPKDFKKAGAAGGVGYAMKAFFNSSMESGIDTILKLVDLGKLVNEYDVVFTGEGRLDSQSLDGKVISGIAKYNPKRMIILCGQNKLLDSNMEVYSIVPDVATVEESMNNSKECLVKLLDKIKIE